MVTPNSNKIIGYEAQLKPLFLRAVAGDKKDLSQLLKIIADLTKKYVIKRTSANVDFDEVVQEVLIAVHKALHTLDTSKPCMPWLAAIMYYKLSDFLKCQYKNKSNVNIDDVQDFLASNVTEDAPDIEYIKEAVENLPEKQKLVIKSMYFNEMSVSEAADKLNMSGSAVKVNAHRAYIKLRKILGQPQ